MLLQQFKIFATVAEHLSITKASRELHLSQPAVSKNLKLLEENYQLILHRKRGRGIELTETGVRLLQHIMPVLSQIEQIKETFCSAGNHTRIKTSRLSIGGGRAQTAVLIPSLLSIYKRTHRRVKVDLHGGSTAQVEAWLEKGRVEIGIITRKSRFPHLISEPVREDSLVAFVRPKHPLARKMGLTLADCNRFSFVVGGGYRGKSFSEKALRSLANSEFSPKISLCCESIEAIKITVKRQNEIGILYRDSVTPELRRGDFVVIHPPGFDFKIENHLVFRGCGTLSKEAADFIEVVRKWRDKATPGPSRAANGKLPHLADS